MSWKKNKTHINILQIIADLVCLLADYFISIFLAGAIFHKIDLVEYLWIPVLFGMVYIFTMFTSEMYCRSTFTYQDRTLKYVIRACILATVFCLVMMPFTAKDTFALNILLIYILVAIIIISIQYLVVQELRQALSSKWRKRAVIIGLQENIQEYLYYIKKTSFQVDVVGCISIDDSNYLSERNLGKIEDLGSILKNQIIDEIIFTVPCSIMEDIRPYILLCKDRGLTVRLAVDFFEGEGQNSSVHSVGTIPVFTYENASLNDVQNLVKRAIDIFGAIMGLIFTAIVSIFIIPLIFIQTGGPIFKRMSYLSVNGRHFILYCFKTGPKGGKFESFISKFLRRTSMNNLPMFWNVLKGDISLVGSLPVPAVNSNALTNHQFKNITLKPGLTGNWRFADKNKLNDSDYLSELNNRYLSKWSFVRDGWLIIKTVAIILTTKTTSVGTSLFACLEENSSYSVETI